jgi:hypothetical protein
LFPDPSVHWLKGYAPTAARFKPRRTQTHLTPKIWDVVIESKAAGAELYFFDAKEFGALEVWSFRHRFEIMNTTPAAARSSRSLRSRADRFDTVYLRAAQAYMLISMPTGTSTIFGVFQVILFSQVIWRDVRAKLA